MVETLLYQKEVKGEDDRRGGEDGKWWTGKGKSGEWKKERRRGGREIYFTETRKL